MLRPTRPGFSGSTKVRISLATEVEHLSAFGGRKPMGDIVDFVGCDQIRHASVLRLKGSPECRPARTVPGVRDQRHVRMASNQGGPPWSRYPWCSQPVPPVAGYETCRMRRSRACRVDGVAAVLRLLFGGHVMVGSRISRGDQISLADLARSAGCPDCYRVITEARLWRGFVTGATIYGLPPNPHITWGTHGEWSSTVTSGFAPVRVRLNLTHVKLFDSFDSSQWFSGSARWVR